MPKRAYVGDSAIMPNVTVQIQMPKGAATPPPSRRAEPAAPAPATDRNS